MPTVGAFVIHGNNADTLRPCLESLTQISDVPVVAVDSGSTDGSREISSSLNAKQIVSPWMGYGAARSLAMSHLDICDYVFFLDSDEYLTSESAAELNRWKKEEHRGRVYRVKRNNWVVASRRSFVLYVDNRARLIRRDLATWSPKMIVHEAINAGPSRPINVVVQHRYAVFDHASERVMKNRRYALLWAIQAHVEGRRLKHPRVQLMAHFAKRAILSRGLITGGVSAIKMSWHAAEYHSEKYKYLFRVRSGEFDSLVSAYKEGRLQDLFAMSSVLRDVAVG